MNLTDEQKAKLFDAMQADGVDNWEGYGESNFQKAMEEIELQNKYTETEDKLMPLFQIIEAHIEVDYPAGREAGTRTVLTEEGVEQIVNWVNKNLLK